MTIINFPKTVAPLSLLADVQDFFGPWSTSPSANLGDYLKGGAYVPDLAENAGIPTIGALDLTNFLGSALDFDWNTQIGHKTVNQTYDSTDNTDNPTGDNITWQFGTDWDLLTGAEGQAEIWWQFSETTTDTRLTISTALSPTSSWGRNHRDFRLNIDPATPWTWEGDVIITGTVTIKVRSKFDNLVVKTTTRNWTFNLIDLGGIGL